MSLISHVKRTGRLIFALIKGFFSWGPRPSPRYPDSPTLLAHIKEVARQDIILFLSLLLMQSKNLKRSKRSAISSMRPHSSKQIARVLFDDNTTYHLS